MKNTHFPYSRDDAVLAAVLASGDPGSPAWEDCLPQEDHANAAAWAAVAAELSDALKMESGGLMDAQRMVVINESLVNQTAGIWSDLADNLARALRMGPGGLSDAQREAILEAASQSVVSRAGSPAIPTAAPRKDLQAWWKWAAAAGIAATLAVLANHYTSSDKANVVVERPAPVVQPPPEYRLRVMPGAAFGSRYMSASAARRIATSRVSDKLPISTAGGFQPVALANMAELIPMPPPGADIALADLVRAESTPGGPWIASLINCFAYDYPRPTAGQLVSISVEAGPCPWHPVNQLVHIGLRASADTEIDPGYHGMIASDVRMMVDFNPRKVAAYRLVGTRPGDRSQHGEQLVTAGANLMAGQLVTVIYEIVPVGSAPSAEDMTAWRNTGGSGGDSLDQDILAAKVIFRQPGGSMAFESSVVLADAPRSVPSADFQFSAAVAAYGLLREQAPGMRHFGMIDALALARAGIGADTDGRRGEFVQLLANQAD